MANSASSPARPAPPPARVSVVVPLFNCLALTQAMLASLQATWPRGLSYEIILVDDGSTDGTREWLATLQAPFRVVLNERNIGYAAANNRGAAVATGELLLLLNNDLVLTHGWLQPMLSAHASLAERAGLVGNVQRVMSTGEIDHAGIIINEKGKPEHVRSRPLRALIPNPWAVQRWPAVTGACLLVSRQLYLDHGGFSEDYVNGCEDVDLAFRLAETGRLNVVALRSVIYHHVSAAPGRKRHDELNTYRLTLRWRETLVRHGTRRWAAHHLQRAWTSPTASTEAWLGAEALAYVCRLRRSAPAHVVMGIRTAIDEELDRWRHLFADAFDEAGPSR